MFLTSLFSWNSIARLVCQLITKSISYLFFSNSRLEGQRTKRKKMKENVNGKYIAKTKSNPLSIPNGFPFFLQIFYYSKDGVD